jgi:hypothetical protein
MLCEEIGGVVGRIVGQGMMGRGVVGVGGPHT